MEFPSQVWEPNEKNPAIADRVRGGIRLIYFWFILLYNYATLSKVLSP
jgi:hypothetical protein